MFVVYVLRSRITARYYIGHTSNLQNRLSKHNAGYVRSTKAYIPWEIVYSENFDSKSNAYRREMQIKSYKGGRAFKTLLNIESHGGVA